MSFNQITCNAINGLPASMVGRIYDPISVGTQQLTAQMLLGGMLINNTNAIINLTLPNVADVVTALKYVPEDFGFTVYCLQNGGGGTTLSASPDGSFVTQGTPSGPNDPFTVVCILTGNVGTAYIV